MTEDAMTQIKEERGSRGTIVFYFRIENKHLDFDKQQITLKMGNI